MAAATLPKPGTEYGPCEATCEHTDCAETREMAEAVCPLCHETIGFDVRFYNSADRGLVHAHCLEVRT